MHTHIGTAFSLTKRRNLACAMNRVNMKTLFNESNQAQKDISYALSLT